MEEEEAELEAVMALTDYVLPLMELSSFKYLGKVLLASENDWPAVISNLEESAT